MTAIAQRRVAGATALMILLYLLQVVLLAPSAGANEGECPEGFESIPYSGSLSWTADADYDVVILVGGPPDSTGNNDDQDGRNKYFYDVEAGDTISRDAHAISHICVDPAESDGPDRPTFQIGDCIGDFRTVTVTVPEGYQFEITDGGVVDDPIPPGSNTFVLSPGSYPWFVHEWGNDQKRIFEGTLTIDDCDPGEGPDRPTFQIGDCVDGVRTVTVTVPEGYQFEITDGGVVDDPIPPGSNTFVLSPGSYPWFVHEWGNDQKRIFEGTLTIDDCDPGEGDLTVKKIVVVVSGQPSTTSFEFTVTDEEPFSLVDGGSKGFSYSLSSAEDTAAVTIAEGAITEVGWTTAISCDDEAVTSGLTSVQVTVGDGDDITCTVTNTFRSPTTTTTTEATTTTTTVPEVTTTTVPQVTTTVPEVTTTIPFDELPEPELEAAEVLGETVVAEVVADTLPFTGFETEDTAKLGLLALVAGGLMLFAVRGRDEEAAETAVAGSWRNH